MDIRQDSRTKSFLNHWARKYIMIPFRPYNCAAFVEFVLKDHFKCEMVFPQTTLNRNKDIELIKQFTLTLKRTDTPEDGDIVLMDGYREACHVGVYADINGVGHVLHSDVNIKSSAIHRISDLFNYRYFLNGYYKWK